MFTKEERSSFPYWFAHWCSYNMTALNCKAWRFKYLFHDFTKPFLRLLFKYEIVQKIHRRNHNHHSEWLENWLRIYNDNYKVTDDIINKLLNRYDFDGTIIDWECSHFTKEASPYVAKDEFERFTEENYFKDKYPMIYKYCYNEFCSKLSESLGKLNLI